MNAEFQLPTPIFGASWECYFARYCKKLSHDTWCVVDFSLDKYLPYSSSKFRRRPSGCLIKEMSYGYSKVTWVEHMVVVNREYYNNNSTKFLQPLVSSGLAFGAPRWLNSLARIADLRLQTLLNPNPIPNPTYYGGGAFISKTVGTGLLNLAGRMMKIFCGDISDSSRNHWMQVPLSSSSSLPTTNYSQLLMMRIMFKNTILDHQDSTGTPQRVRLIFSTSLWLPTPPLKLFDFLRDANSTAKWGVFSHLCPAQELGYVIQGNDSRNRVSIIQANIGLYQHEQGMLFVQESHMDSTSSYVVFSHVEKLALSNIFNGGNPDNVTIMPSGFTILPDGMVPRNSGGDTGSILTIANDAVLNITGNQAPISHGAVEVFETVIANTITNIEEAIKNNYS